MIPFLYIAAILQVRFTKDFKIRDIITRENILSMFKLGIVGNFMTMGYIISGKYTVMSHACVFNSLSGPLIVIARIIAGGFVHKLEILGTSIALTGCVITLLDPSAQTADAQSEQGLFGDFLGIIGSFAGAYYFTLGE
jgi:predicted phage tail protein